MKVEDLTDQVSEFSTLVSKHFHGHRLFYHPEVSYQDREVAMSFVRSRIAVSTPPIDRIEIHPGGLIIFVYETVVTKVFKISTEDD